MKIQMSGKINICIIITIAIRFGRIANLGGCSQVGTSEFVETIVASPSFLNARSSSADNDKLWVDDVHRTHLKPSSKLVS